MTDFPTHGRLIMDADDPAAIRLRKRRNAETRMKAYGILAIVLSIAALVVLLSSVVFQATSALTETYVVMDVELTEEDLDPKDTNSPRTESPPAEGHLPGLPLNPGGPELIKYINSQDIFAPWFANSKCKI